ncbi:uncharacterized protein [Nicotiana tomentosiformis]|uniref:uncharacterized protein n=1 Tax=Nicotiana tomentosiformis TaxID=4098 RepID=UPI00388C5B57
MEVYIDDMLVKSLRAEDHLKYFFSILKKYNMKMNPEKYAFGVGLGIKHFFSILKKYNMKMNPEKYAFGVGLGKFCGFVVSNWGIEINPDKIKAIEDITVVDNVKVV